MSERIQTRISIQSPNISIINERFEIIKRICFFGSGISIHLSIDDFLIKKEIFLGRFNK